MPAQASRPMSCLSSCGTPRRWRRTRRRSWRRLARDAIAYIAYPKAGQLGTDLNRDVLWGMVRHEGLRGVRQVSLDDVWSAMRFRPERVAAEA